MMATTMIYDLLEKDDMTEDLQLLVDICGLEAIKELLKNLNGMSFYIPRITSFDSLIKKYLKLHKASNPKNIAMELGLSHQHIRRILKKIE